MLARNQTYRAFVARPTHILDITGELLDSVSVMSQLAAEVRDISAYATYVVRNDVTLGERLALAGTVQPATAGRRAGVTIPEFLVPDKKRRERRTIRGQEWRAYQTQDG